MDQARRMKELEKENERRGCRVLGQHRSTQRQTPSGADDEAALTEDIIALARQYGRYGYRRITALLSEAGWHVSFKRVERIWRREGFKVPQKQPKPHPTTRTTNATFQKASCAAENTWINVRANFQDPD